VLVAIGNSGDVSLAVVAQRLLSDPNPVVAEAAEWACRRLQVTSPARAGDVR